MLLQGILIAIVCYFAGMTTVWLGQPMLDRPLVIGAMVGLILGDLKTGVMCGAQLELVFIGVSQIGTSNPPDAVAGTAIGTAFAILNGQSIETAMALAVPVATLVIMVNTFTDTIKILINPLAVKLIEKGDEKNFKWFMLLNPTIKFLPRAVIILFGILAANANVIEQAIASIPTTLMEGLAVGGGMIAAVGIGILLQSMWTKKTAVYFFLGFLVISYFELNLLAVALFGIILAIILYLENNNSLAAENVDMTEGDLFDD